MNLVSQRLFPLAFDSEFRVALLLMRTGLSGSLIIFKLALPVFLKGTIRGRGQRFRRVRRPLRQAALANAARLPVGGWLKLNDKLKRIQVQSAFFLPGRR